MVWIKLIECVCVNDNTTVDTVPNKAPGALTRSNAFIGLEMVAFVRFKYLPSGNQGISNFLGLVMVC